MNPSVGGNRRLAPHPMYLNVEGLLLGGFVMSPIRDHYGLEDRSSEHYTKSTADMYAWAYGSAKNFSIQLGPLASELERRGLATFTYSQGAHEVDPPEGWEDYFGARPLFRFLDTRHGDNFENLRRLRHMPYSINAEDAIRLFQDTGKGEDWHQHVLRDALNDVFRTIDEHPDVDALIGYSEGAMLAASLIVEEAILEEKTGRPRRIKFAIFISGAPPLKMEGDDRVVCQLADEAGTVIDIPTFHIFGCDDAFLGGAVALYNVN
ncbi:hypothetical protein VTI74DRAFT_7254 [Chaetomium olivicolor]